MNPKSNQNINYLPLNIQSRLELYLTINKLKPASTLSLRTDKKSSILKLQYYLKQNSVFFEVDSSDPSFYFVSLVAEKAKTLSTIWHTNSDESETKKGFLLGYPTEAVKGFVKYSKSKDRDIYLTGVTEKNFPFTKIPHWPYIGFVVRKGYEELDSETVKNWSDFVKTNNPILASWYEKRILSALGHLHK